MKKFAWLLPLIFCVSIRSPAQQVVTNVPIETINPFDQTQPMMQMYCAPGQSAHSNLMEWQVSSGLFWSDPLRNRTHTCYVDCNGQLHCSTPCGSMFTAGCAGASNPVSIYVNNTLIGTEPNIDFDAGTNVTLSGLDDLTNHKIHVTVNATNAGACGAAGISVPDSEVCAGPIAPTGTLSPNILQMNSAAWKTGSSTTVPYINPVTAGNGLLVIFYCFGYPGSDCGGLTASTTVTDSQGNTFHTGPSGSSQCSMGYGGAQAYWATAGHSAADSITVATVNTLDDVGIFEVPNLGAFEGLSCGNNIVSPPPISESYTTTNAGDLLVGLGVELTNASPSFLYQTSHDWLPLLPEVCGTEEFQWSATNAGSPTTRTLAFTANGFTGCLNCETEEAIFAFEPAVYPPASTGPPSFRLTYPSDLPALAAIEQGAVCAASSGSGTAYTCSTSPAGSVIPPVILFQPDIANTGTSATLAVNGALALPISKLAGNTTTLSIGDIAAAPAQYIMVNDGTTWEIASETVTSGSYVLPTAQKIRSIVFDNDTQSATALTTAQLTGHAQVGAAMTLFEVDIFADTGTSSVNISKVHLGTTTALMSAALPTGASGALACASLNAKCVDGSTSASGSVSIVTTGSANVLAAGDIIEITGATADGTATRVTAVPHLTVN